MCKEIENVIVSNLKEWNWVILFSILKNFNNRKIN